MTRATAPTIAALVLAAAACSGGGGDDLPDDLDVIAASRVEGTIAGAPWAIGTTEMHVTGNELWVDLMPNPAADCTIDETQSDYPFVIFFLPTTPGRYALGETQFVTFVDAPSSNLIVGHGVIQLDSITADTVSGGLHVFDAEFGEIDGRFDGALCYSN